MFQDKIDNVYEILRQTQAACVVFDSPHSGSIYPRDFKHQIPMYIMRAAEDSAVDDLFASVSDKGGVMLRALFPRTYIDANRYETDIAPHMVKNPAKWNLGFEPTDKSSWGHGLIRETLCYGGTKLYKKPLAAKEIMARIEKYHRPYHEALKTLIDEAHDMHGQVWHINCHSMPSSCVSANRKTDFCLGDDFGNACYRAELTDMVKSWLENRGYRVDVNVPFAGGRLVKDYAAPSQGRQSLQIEINKAIYWDEANDKPSKDYNRIKSDMESLSGYIIDTAQSRAMPLAAN